MVLDKEILRVLSEVGEDGLSIKKIAIHVHNACNSFFDRMSYDEVHAYVTGFLIRNSKKPHSLIEKGEQRGYYRLNRNSYMTQQLMLQFMDEEKRGGKCSEDFHTDEDQSLSLF